MEKIYCHVCKRMIPKASWRNHIKREKQLNGEDIYQKLRQERMKRHSTEEPETDKPLSDFRKR